MPNIKKAADEFDAWMKKWTHDQLSDNEHLINYLDADMGFQYIKSYEELCQLASLVQEKGYQTSNPPCTPVEFAQAVHNAFSESFGDKKPVISQDMWVELAATLFETLMKNWNCTNIENWLLLSFLQDHKGFQYIKSYEELEQLVSLVQQKGYQTIKPLCTPLTFAKAVQKADPKSFGDQKPVLSQYMRLELAVIEFNDYYIEQLANDSNLVDDIDNVKFISYLCDGKSAEYIQSYEEYCQLAKLLVQEHAFQINEPPCTQKEYEQTMARIHPKSFAKNAGIFVQPLISLEQEKVYTHCGKDSGIYDTTIFRPMQ
ncbi:MAG: hypothetical protein HKM04_04785 [Legionellales bacterium]|nr:hypothetical protein [Legionellales bacterium]